MRAKVPGADWCSAALDRHDLRLRWQTAGSSRGGRSWAMAWATAVLAAVMERGMNTRPRSVENVLPSQYQRWSALCLDIITAERSLPPSDVAAAGLHLLQQLSEGRNAQVIGRDRVGSRRTSRDPLILRAIELPCRSRSCDRSNQKLAMIRSATDAAGHDGRMARTGLGRIVRLISVAEHRTAGQAADAPSGEPILVVRSAESWSIDRATTSLGAPGDATAVEAGWAQAAEARDATRTAARIFERIVTLPSSSAENCRRPWPSFVTKTIS